MQIYGNTFSPLPTKGLLWKYTDKGWYFLILDPKFSTDKAKKQAKEGTWWLFPRSLLPSSCSVNLRKASEMGEARFLRIWPFWSDLHSQPPELSMWLSMGTYLACTGLWVIVPYHTPKKSNKTCTLGIAETQWAFQNAKPLNNTSWWRSNQTPGTVSNYTQTHTPCIFFKTSIPLQCILYFNTLIIIFFSLHLSQMGLKEVNAIT